MTPIDGMFFSGEQNGPPGSRTRESAAYAAPKPVGLGPKLWYFFGKYNVQPLDFCPMVAAEEFVRTVV